jgi:hypothetical protein
MVGPASCSDSPLGPLPPKISSTGGQGCPHTPVGGLALRKGGELGLGSKDGQLTDCEPGWAE